MAQGVGAVAPRAQKEPEGHTVHAALDVALTAAEKVPAGQSAGLALPTQKEPGAHGAHEFCTSPAESVANEPGGHELCAGTVVAAPQK